MKLSSSAFENNGKIPIKYSCDGENINPDLKILDAPDNTKSFVLIMDDPDIPDFVKERLGVDVFDHWVIFNIAPNISVIEEGAEPKCVLGKNSSGKLGYTGPCPPDKEHRYFFKIYALNNMLNLPEGATKKEVENAMEGHILDKIELIGRYERK